MPKVDNNKNSNSPFGTFDWSNPSSGPASRPKDITSDMWTPISAGKSAQQPASPSRLNDREKAAPKKSDDLRGQKKTPAGKRPQSAQKKKSAPPQKKTQGAKKRPPERTAQSGGSNRETARQTERKPAGSAAEPRPQQQRKAAPKANAAREQKRLENDRKRYEKSSREYNKQRSAGKAGEEITKKRAKKKRRSKRFYALVVTGITLLAATAAVLIYCFAVGSPISEIVVDGESIYSAKEIATSCGVVVGDNIFTVGKQRVSEAVCKALPYIGSVEVKRNFPDKLSLTVTPTTDKYLIKTKSGAYICLDENDKVLSLKKKKVKNGSFRLEGFEGQEVEPGTQYVPCEEDKKRFEIAKSVAAVFENGTLKNVNVIDLTDINKIVAVYDSHYNIFIGSTDDLENKIALASSILKKSAVKNGKGYVDVRISGMAAFYEGSMEPQ